MKSDVAEGRIPGSEESILDRLEQLFTTRGTELYLGEPVTIAEHMLQCAALAQAQGAADALIAAALLHDIGHFTAREDEGSGVADWKHEESGAAILEGHFPPVVVASVRLHVAAKRYLCATGTRYFDKLSGASKHSLSLQGGPMSASEAAMFEALPYHREAIRIRLWDDWGKEQGRKTPGFGDFRPLLQRVLPEHGLVRPRP